MQNIINSLLTNGCKPIIQKGFTVALQCNNSVVMKSPSQQWSVLIPATKLEKVQKSLLSKKIPPYSIDIGEFVQRGTWGMVQKFTIPDEVLFYHNHVNLEKVTNPQIHSLHQELSTIQKNFSSPTIAINLYSEFKKRVRSIADQVNYFTQQDLQKSHNSQPIICKSTPHVFKNIDATRGEYPVYKINTHCLVPKVQKHVEEVLDSVLTESRIAQYDLRYINSKMTKDKAFVLSGVQLFQQGTTTPYLKFAIDNEQTLTNPNFLKRLNTLEKQFSKEKLGDLPPLTEQELLRNLL